MRNSIKLYRTTSTINAIFYDGSKESAQDLMDALFESHKDAQCTHMVDSNYIIISNSIGNIYLYPNNYLTITPKEWYTEYRATPQEIFEKMYQLT